MKIVITGAGGQLGKALTGQLAGKDFIAATRDMLDITNQEATFAFLAQHQPDVVIHAAAYTNVDGAEQDEVGAYSVNALGSQNVASACLKIGAKMVYVSTDYVFDGDADKPYLEFTATNPQGVYGQSKLAGEMVVRQILNRSYIVRTSWLYGDGNNFVRTMLKLGKERSELKIVNDQYGCPTYTEDLAEAILRLIQTESYGTYHAVNQGITTWHDFAKKIFALSKNDRVTVLPQTTEELNRPAPRPKYSPLGGRMLALATGKKMRTWEEALADYLCHEGCL